MEIKSKFDNNEKVLYGTKPVTIIEKMLDTNTNIWTYKIENRLLRIFETVKEEKLNKIV